MSEFMRKVKRTFSVAGNGPSLRACPEEHLLAAYADQQLVGPERNSVESHLANCDECASTIAFLVSASHETNEVPESLLRRAATFGAQRQPENRQSVPWKVAFTTAAAAIVAGAFLILWQQKPQMESTPHAQVTQAPSLRAADQVIANPGSIQRDEVRGSERSGAPVLISPREGKIKSRESLVVEWKPLPGAVSYHVQLMDANGDQIWQQQVSGSKAAIPASVKIQANARYYVWVSAEMKSGETLQSRAIGFEVE